MKLSSNGKKLIQSYEGLRLESYKVVETEKYYTIGYGHYGADVSRGDKITKKEAEALFDKDVQKFVDGVNKYVTVTINQNQFDALVSFSYNCGLGNLQSSTLLQKVNKKDFEGAANEFPRWNKSGGKVLAGLTRRRKEERQLFMTPVKASITIGDTYKVKKGDTLGEIALNHNLTLSQIIQLNPQIKDPNVIKVGQAITVKDNAVHTYVVQKGDSLSKIAAAKKTTVKDLLAKNPEIKNKDLIKIGQKIVY